MNFPKAPSWPHCRGTWVQPGCKEGFPSNVYQVVKVGAAGSVGLTMWA